MKWGYHHHLPGLSWQGQIYIKLHHVLTSKLKWQWHACALCQTSEEGNSSTNVESELEPNYHHQAQHVEVQNCIQLQRKFTSCSKLKWQSQWLELRRALLSVKFASNCNRNLQHGYMLSFQIFSSQQHQLIQGRSISSNPHKQIQGKEVKIQKCSMCRRYSEVFSNKKRGVWHCCTTGL